jgi:phenylacetate-CoA ligase
MLIIALKRKKFLSYYNFVKTNEFKSFKKLKKYQEEKLKKLIIFSYENVPYYYHLFNKLNLKPDDICHIEDLQKLPILTKEIIRKCQKEFIPSNIKDLKFVNMSTGGSTGNPLRYRLSKDAEMLSTALGFANWGYADYKLGDKMVTIAGSSLVPKYKSKIKMRLRAMMMNNKSFSSFDLNEKNMNKIIKELNRFKPKYIRGYASSIYLLANYIKDNNIKIDFQPTGILTTAEVLHDYQREIIEKIFSCEVFNQYGLNDGGISAFECKKHNGLHIDMIRAIMEVVDNRGNQLESNKEGIILATDLYNYAMPFIRYATGDLGILSNNRCNCGRDLPLLKKIVGRVSDFIYSPNGNKIHGEFFSHIFGRIDWVKQFQIIQNDVNQLIIKIIPDNKELINKKDIEKLKKIVILRTGDIKINIEIVDYIASTQGGKWKFIIRTV